MRHCWLIVLASVASSAPAAPRPVPGSAPADPEALHRAAGQFAAQVHLIVERVAADYVRPVPRELLIEAAAEGLFQAARRPAPRDLRAQVREAVSLSSALRAEAAPEAGPNGPIRRLSARRAADPVERMLARLRFGLGDVEFTGDPVVAACRSLARRLDPYSGILSPEDQRRTAALEQESVGVGLDLKPLAGAGPLEVEAVHPGGPAQRAGLRPGDLITRLDGRPAGKAPPPLLLALRGRAVDEGVTLLARPGGPPEEGPRVPDRVRVAYRRPGDKDERTADLARERHRPEVLGVRRNEDNSWDYMLAPKGVAHVRLTALSRGAADELRSALAGLGEHQGRGLILDLRWCPGGWLQEAVAVAELFLGEATVATVKYRGKDDEVRRSVAGAKFRDLPMVVLVNAETSGGAELIAAALQDHRRAAVVGQRTFGKASVQTVIESVGADGLGFKLTSGTFERPAGGKLHRFPEDGPGDEWGVRPDVDARLSPELGRRLKGWWLAQSLRPAASAERLPLDDPQADPQQRAALAAALKRARR